MVVPIAKTKQLRVLSLSGTNGSIYKRDEALPIHTRLPEVSKAKGFTATEIAVRLDVTRRAVIKWFSGEIPSGANFERLCDLLNCQPGDLWTFMRPLPPLHLFTTGYEGENLDQFVGKLHAAGIQVLVDTRATPLSRKPGFSKTRLSERLAAEGIEYVHIRALGTAKEWRAEYYADNDWEKLASRYSEYLRDQGAAIQAVFDTAKSKTSCLFCFEADHERCHRSILADFMASSSNRPLEVVHL